MNHDKRGLRDLCAQVHDEDGRRPERREGAARPAGRKDLQLCKQVLRALDGHMAAASWAANIGLRVVSVLPDPDATRLQTLVRWNGPETATAVMTLLAARRGELRSAAAAAITRKRAPQLTFAPVPREEVHDE
jgi:hypothetical protein